MTEFHFISEQLPTILLRRNQNFKPSTITIYSIVYLATVRKFVDETEKFTNITLLLKKYSII